MRNLKIALASGVLLALIGAGCTEIAFNVTKETTGDGVPSGSFEVDVTCDGVTDTLTFDGPYPQAIMSQDFDLDESADCTLVETDPANAVTTTMECVEPIPAGVTCTPTAEGLEVSATEEPGPDVLVEVTVTNDLGTTAPTTTTTIDPNALNAIVTTPNFTG